ncbi:hypothetical protein G7Y89_g10787 [Cudoniella acicularis]|uniref:F-box domain-containing protein n=1 Tax=Cudoniella acicularis TaxID=354080 RepID=A0A8H4RD58_9HELO|nr:hypothetical protein G7Y89_g10787 [Cudoniella acicularis]
MNITELPNDIFLLIVANLSPEDIILSRRVCKQFNAAFTESELSRHVLLQHYPRVRELRNVDDNNVIWSNVLSRVASRYHYLKAGTPRGIERFALGKSLVVPEWSRFYPVAPWQRHLQFEEKVAPFHYPDTLWTYDEGILVFPSTELQQYAIYDLNAGTLSQIDIESEKKTVRRIRLIEKVLVVEWCEPEAYHQLNENETVHRHFATAYDVRQDDEGRWNAIFRNEWKIHFLGMPLNSRDRFFSSHTSTHYALYLWQPNRSAWGEDEPIEGLAIWDISSPSYYRPSEDPTGKTKPADDLEGARVLRRFSFADLAFYKIRQRSGPVLRGLKLDENHIYIIQEDHRWVVGQQASSTLPRLHRVKSTGIPFFSSPFWEDQCGADGDVNLSFCERASDMRSPNFAPCWRHEEFPYLTITEAVDANAGVIFSARHCFMLETISINIKPKIRMIGPGYEVSLRDDIWQQLLGKGKLCGDERWLIGENTNDEVVILHFDRAAKAMQQC